MDQFTDEALVDEIRSGSRVSFVELMKRHERTVYRISFSYTHDSEDAMDVLQNVFLKVHEKLGTYRGKGAFKAWLLRIAHRENLNWVRDQGKHRGHEELGPANAPVARAEQEERVLEAERRCEILEGLADLNPRQRLAVALRYYDQMPIREIAQVLECNEGVAKNILFRSIQKLRGRLAARLQEDHT